VSSFLITARVAVLLFLGIVAISSLVLSPSRESLIPLALTQAILLALAIFLLFRNWCDLFAIAAGLQVLVGVVALALNPNNGFIWPWAMLGLGLAAIMAGIHTCRSFLVLTFNNTSEGGMDTEFRRVALHGYFRILTFIGLVWLISLFILLISMNAALGPLPYWLMAILALLVMVSLAWLALARRTEG
jgi:hypothetical protein